MTGAQARTDDRMVIEQWRHRTLADSFGAEAATYERGRPEYPDEAVAWLVGDAARVADVGAGTGKLTRVLARLGREVTAVEPDAAMRAQLEASVPGVPVLDGTGEGLPLPDASVDAVTYGQAWHWVEPMAGSAEAARVLKPDGVLGLIWNVRDPDAEWVARLTTIMHEAPGEVMALSERPPSGPPFNRAELRTWSWVRPMTPDDLEALVASRSYVITAPDARRAKIMDGVRGLLATHPDLAGRDEIDVPYRTIAWRLTR